MKILTPSFFQRSTPVVAHDLIGCILEHTISDNDVRTLRIVETEAYLAENDAACHASTRRTKRNEAMFDAGGVLYVYLIYGIHHCAKDVDLPLRFYAANSNAVSRKLRT
ncbi:MAG: DNA-3-methyladenine glycosylase [bacterium]|nr:DNA-3-methyladenine glycosylase [bacterium]